MGGLDRFLGIPGQLRSTYRLGLLDTDAALRAIQLPPAQELASPGKMPSLRNCAPRTCRWSRTGGSGEPPRRGTHVEPVLLQVVCDSLWRKVSGEVESFTRISSEDIKAFRPLDTALRRYYSYAVRKAANGDGAVERAIREWIQERLLTKQGLRSQTSQKPPVQNDQRVLQLLQERYLIRSDPRTTAIWWELSHDRLVNRYLRTTANGGRRIWNRGSAGPINGNRIGITPCTCCEESELRQARSASSHIKITDFENEFLRQSALAAADQGLLQRAQSRVDLLRVLLNLSLVLNLVLIAMLLIRVFK